MLGRAGGVSKDETDGLGQVPRAGKVEWTSPGCAAGDLLTWSIVGCAGALKKGYRTICLQSEVTVREQLEITLQARYGSVLPHAVAVFDRLAVGSGPQTVLGTPRIVKCFCECYSSVIPCMLAALPSRRCDVPGLALWLVASKASDGVFL